MILGFWRVWFFALFPIMKLIRGYEWMCGNTSRDGLLTWKKNELAYSKQMLNIILPHNAMGSHWGLADSQTVGVLWWFCQRRSEVEQQADWIRLRENCSIPCCFFCYHWGPCWVTGISVVFYCGRAHSGPTIEFDWTERQHFLTCATLSVMIAESKTHLKIAMKECFHESPTKYFFLGNINRV